VGDFVLTKPIRASSITIGADPEFFLFHKGKPVPAYKSGITGTKDKPQQLKGGGAVQIDGMALEFNIKPQVNGASFYKAICDTLAEIRDMVDPSLEFRFIPEVTFDLEDFKATPDQYKELGCDPDFDAYKKSKEKAPPASAANDTFRCAGGHIHFGWLDPTPKFNPMDSNHLHDCEWIINALESLRPSSSKFRKRVALYGSRGSYRPKPYGLEWRSPSNEWLNYRKEDIIGLVNEYKGTVNHLLTEEINLQYSTVYRSTREGSNARDYVYERVEYYKGVFDHATSPARVIQDYAKHKFKEAVASKLKSNDELKFWNALNTTSTSPVQKRKVA
jgi:hypothetical protein